MHITRSLTLATALALSALPSAAFAGKHEQAVEAIAQARGKIQAGDKVGTNAQAPELQDQARAALANAERLLSKGKKSDAIIAAQHAGDLADQAIVSADNRKMSAERDRRLDAQSSAIEAQQAAANATVRADAAQQAIVNANVRADAAQMATAAANAQTQAALSAPKPAPTTTTVAIVERETVQTRAPSRQIKRRVAPRRHSAIRTRKTTTVTTTNR